MQWSVALTKWYAESLESLPNQIAVWQTLYAIVRQLEVGALDWPCVAGTNIRFVTSPQYRLSEDELVPALGVFYYVKGTDVLLLWAQTYAEKDAVPDMAQLPKFRFDN
jgi:hypothetical protein